MTNPRRAVAAEGKHWSPAQKVEAVTTYLLLGSIAKTAAVLKIPEGTMAHWTRTPWWKETVADLQLQDELEMSTRLKRIVSKSLELVEDRFENGDYVYDQKTGEMRRKPVNAKDAAKIGIDYDNRRDTILKRQTPQDSPELIEDKLNKLAAKFAAIVNGKKTPDEEITDVQSRVIPVGELSDSVYSDSGDGRPDRLLQEDEGEVA